MRLSCIWCSSRSRSSLLIQLDGSEGIRSGIDGRRCCRQICRRGGVPIIVVLEGVVNIEISSFAVIICRVKSSASSISFSMSSTWHKDKIFSFNSFKSWDVWSSVSEILLSRYLAVCSWLIHVKGESFHLCRLKNHKNWKLQPEKKHLIKSRRVALVATS